MLKQHGLELVNSLVVLRITASHEGGGVRCSELPQRARKIMKPVRFLIACEDGHIDDFPWSSGFIEVVRALRQKRCSSLPQQALMDTVACKSEAVYVVLKER